MNKFKQVLRKGKDKVVDFCDEHIIEIAMTSCAVVGFAYGYGIGKLSEALQLDQGLQECFKQDPELEQRLFNACIKAKQEQIPWNSLK